MSTEFPFELRDTRAVSPVIAVGKTIMDCANQAIWSGHEPVGPTPGSTMSCPSPHIHRITPDCQPKFPCWAYASRCKPPQWLLIMDGYDTVEELLAVGYTHYCSVKPPTAPTSRPERMEPELRIAHEQVSEMVANHERAAPAAVPLSATPTPRTDSQIAANEFYTSNGQHCLTINFAILARTLERELAAKDAELNRLVSQHALIDSMRYKAFSELSEQDRILRSSVREEFKNCTSPVGAVQNEIAALETELAASREECERVKLDLGHLHGRIGLFAEKWWMINNNLSTDETFKQMEEQIVDIAQKYTYLMNDRDQLRAENTKLRGLLGEAADEISMWDIRCKTITAIRAALSGQIETFVKKSTKNTENPT